MGRLVGVLADVLALARLALELRTAYSSNRDALKRASARGLGSDPRYPGPPLPPDPLAVAADGAVGPDGPRSPGATAGTAPGP